MVLTSYNFYDSGTTISGGTLRTSEMENLGTGAISGRRGPWKSPNNLVRAKKRPISPVVALLTWHLPGLQPDGQPGRRLCRRAGYLRQRHAENGQRKLTERKRQSEQRCHTGIRQHRYV